MSERNVIAAQDMWKTFCSRGAPSSTAHSSRDLGSNHQQRQRETLCMNPQDKAGMEHWDDTWASPPRMRLPLASTSSIRDKMSLLRSVVRPGMKFLEIGCAPGKMLSWVAAALGAEVSGLDYSGPGVRVARRLFRELGLAADIRNEDVFSTTFAAGSFDVVYSAGVIEHFEDPSEIVRIHAKLLKPGGVALITIPNLAGFYGRWASKENLAIHNLDIMTPEALRRLAPRDLSESVESFRDGRFTLAMGVIDHRWGRLANAFRMASDLAGLAQPFHVEALCPTHGSEDSGEHPNASSAHFENQRWSPLGGSAGPRTGSPGRQSRGCVALARRRPDGPYGTRRARGCTLSILGFR